MIQSLSNIIQLPCLETFPFFVKQATKETLALNFVEAIAMEKELHAIGVIIADDESKDSKESCRKYQASSSKEKENDSSNIEIFTKTLKALTSEVLELKRRSSETSTSIKPPKSFPFRRNNNNNNNQPIKYAQSLNVVLNIKSMGMDNYCSFHQEYQ